MGPIDFDVDGPGLALLTGHSGAGKTTLLRALAGVLLPFDGGRTDGTLHRDGRDPMPQDVALLPQDPIDAFLSYDARHEFILRHRLAGARLAPARAQADAHLTATGLGPLADVDLQRLSGGERRRVALEAILLNRPGLLLLDEPLDHLDATRRRRVARRILAESHQRRVVVATHDPTPFADHADAQIRLPPIRHTAHAPLPPPTDRSATPEARIQVHGLDHGMNGRRLLGGLDLDLGPGLHVLTGDNGSGKTTLLRILFGFERPAAGRVRIAGVDPLREGPHGVARVAVLLFEHASRMFFAATVAEETTFGLPPGHPVDAALRWADLDRQAHQNPHTLSGGERERLAHAILATRVRPVVLLDEPTHGLDPKAFGSLVDLLLTWRTRRCVVVATHDERLLAHADTRLHLEDGRLTRPPARPEVAPSIPG